MVFKMSQKDRKKARRPMQKRPDCPRTERDRTKTAQDRKLQDRNITTTTSSSFNKIGLNKKTDFICACLTEVSSVNVLLSTRWIRPKPEPQLPNIWRQYEIHTSCKIFRHDFCCATLLQVKFSYSTRGYNYSCQN